MQNKRELSHKHSKESGLNPKFEKWVEGFKKGYGKPVTMWEYLENGWFEHKDWPLPYQQGICDGRRYLKKMKNKH